MAADGRHVRGRQRRFGRRDLLVSTHRDRRTRLTLAPVGSFSLREREPIEWASAALTGEWQLGQARARQGSARPRRPQLGGDGEPNSIARAREVDALLLPHPHAEEVRYAGDL